MKKAAVIREPILIMHPCRWLGTGFRVVSRTQRPRLDLGCFGNPPPVIGELAVPERGKWRHLRIPKPRKPGQKSVPRLTTHQNFDEIPNAGSLTRRHSSPVSTERFVTKLSALLVARVACPASDCRIGPPEDLPKERHRLKIDIVIILARTSQSRAHTPHYCPSIRDYHISATRSDLGPRRHVVLQPCSGSLPARRQWRSTPPRRSV